MKTYCSPAGRTSSQQGQLPPDFWRNVALKSGTGKNGKKYIQRECHTCTVSAMPSNVVLGVLSDGVYPAREAEQAQPEG